MKITIDRATVEQALEALESVYGDSCDALHAIRAALAQQAKPQGCDHCNHPLYAATRCRVCGRVTEPKDQAEPVQEPVAWLYEAGTDRTLHWYKPPLHGTPLYTAPPQRKPLTEEEINEIAQTNLGDYRDGEWHLLFARAVEAAHGIKE